MNDLISRQAAIDSLTEIIMNLKNIYGDMGSAVNGARECIKSLPFAEPERKKGKWVWEKKIPFERCRCSECGYCRQLKFPEPDYFCPNCGAEMMNRGE